MTRNKAVHLAIALLIIFALFIPVNLTTAQITPARDIAGGVEDNVEIILEADGAPAPGGTTQLSFQATPLIDAPEVVIHWYIPDGVQLVGNPEESYPDAAAGQPITSVRTLFFPNPGTYKVAVSVRLNITPGLTYGSSGVLFFVVDRFGPRVTDMDPDAVKPSRHDPSNVVTVTMEPANTDGAVPNDDPCFTILVHADRIERDATQDGFNPAYRIPLAGIQIEVRESDIAFDDSYGSLGTDDNGDLAASFCDDDGLFDDELEIYLRITAERGDPIVYVEDSSYIDEKYEYDTDYQSSSGGVLSFNISLGEGWSAIFNIVDAGWQARHLWVTSGGSYPEETEIHWEPGYGDDTSYYTDYYDEITIADDPSDPDEWDDAIVMHEWGHASDNHYSCDDSPGDDHAPGMEIDPELSWGEGYPTYYSSAVRDYFGYPDANWMIDIDASGTPGNHYNLETKNFPISIKNQGAVSVVLWDLYDDSPYDYPDLVSYGHAAIQNIYTSSEFMDEAYGLFDDTCDFDTFMHGWVAAGMPADRNTAAIVLDDTGYTLAPGKLIAENQNQTVTENDLSPADVYRWWKQLTYVADNSYSMHGPKFDAMKTLFIEAVNDLGEDPQGTEFTLDLFNNTSTSNETKFAGQFYPQDLIGPINSLTTIAGPDNTCTVNALNALAQASANREDGDIWLFTDGDTTQNPSIQSIRQLLNENQLRSSTALMGICSKQADDASLTQPFSTQMLEGLTPEQQQELMSERLLAGQARSNLGLMADDVPGGIVPYLLTALNSGGMFLYVDESQVEDAADILRAQITNSAGAGRWSDYVSDQPTYRFDTLASWEYEWVNAMLYGTYQGNPAPNLRLDIDIPGYFQYFSGPYYNKVHVFEDGYVTLGSHYAYIYNNTTLPNPAEPNNALYPFWDNIRPFCPPGAENSPGACQGYIYTMQQGDWFVIEFYKYEAAYGTYPLNIFEILLNLETYEIRYQYQTVPNGAEGATIGLENASGNNGIQLSYNDVNGADDEMGYKFVPAPPQPTKTYTVTVDSSMDSVGFLLTGYSGSFEPLLVTDPNGYQVNCNSFGTYCLDLDLVQYVQVNTNGRTGDWHAVVDAGNSGSGTFSFTSFAASPIAVEGQTNHTLSSGSQQIFVEVSGGVDGAVLTGHFNLANGGAFGSNVKFYDDGLHNDHLAGDGLYGSGNYYPPGAGNAYLTLHGTSNGRSFTRIDPVPYNFQPFKVVSLGDGANYGGVTQLQFQFTNYSGDDHCYWITYNAPEGWWIDYPLFPIVCADAGQTVTGTFDVYMTDGYNNYLPSGTTGILTLSATEIEKGLITDSASARITRNRQPAKIKIFNPNHYLRPNGDTVNLEFMVTDLQGVVVADGTVIQLATNNGDITPVFAETRQGSFTATFTSGENLSPALILAQASNGVTASTEIQIGNPIPHEIRLTLSPNQLPADGISTSTLVATVLDDWGNPVANQTVQIGIEGDDAQFGLINGLDQEVVSGVTDAYGQFSATFTNAGLVGKAGIRAELIYYEAGQPVVSLHDRKMMYIGIQFIHLPLVRRSP